MACTPPPTIVSTSASALASPSAAIAAVIAVLAPEITSASMTVTGAPVVSSNSTMTPWCVGRSTLPGKRLISLVASPCPAR